MEPNLDQTSKTLDSIRTLWPIVAIILGLIWTAINYFFEFRNLKKDYQDFKGVQYEKDKHLFLKSIREVAENQRLSERKLEEKFDKLGHSTETKLDKLTDAVNQANLVLAEMKGRSYPKNQVRNNPI